MKTDLSSPLVLLAKSVLDPLRAPAALLDHRGTECHANALWQQPLHDSDATYRSLWGWAAFESGCFADFLKSGAASMVLPCVSEHDVFHAIRLTGPENWIDGVIVLATPAQEEDTRIRREHILEDPHQGIWDVNCETGKRYCSSGWQLMRGRSPNHRRMDTYQEWLSRIHPADRDDVEQRRDALFKYQANFVFDEYRERHADGHWIWIMSRGQVIGRQKDGRPTRIIGIDTNITHLKLGAGRLDEQDRRLKLAISAANFGLWEYDSGKDEVFWDQRTRAFYGIEEPRSRWPGSFWQSFLHPDDKEDILRREKNALRSGTDHNLQFRILRRDGEVRHLRTRATHVTDSMGNDKVLGVTWDVTEDAKRAAEIKEAYALIQQRNDALESAKAELEHRALHDALTGLANRRKLDAFFKLLLFRSEGAAVRAAVLQIDLDYFKEINDSFGHATGDAVLKRLAHILVDAAPPESVVARVGGDEFTVLMAEAGSDADIRAWANHVIAQAQIPIDYDGGRCGFGVSIGVASGLVSRSAKDNLFSLADLALYDAKAAGRGVVRFFRNSLFRNAQKTRAQREALQIGVNERQFGCYYQPQYDVTGRHITGIEALVRWWHPSGEIFAPDAFLSLAEELGLVATIDSQVLATVVRDCSAWQAQGKTVPRIFVNVSARRLLDPHLPEQVAFLKDCGVKIGFELLETVFMDQADPNLKTNIAALRSLGVAIDVDDFGSGHASILCLRNLRPDRIKIDQELIRDAPHDPEQRALVRAIVDIGEVMRMGVVAEGVETDEHVRILQELGCGYLQGYGLSRPQPADVIAEMLPSA